VLTERTAGRPEIAVALLDGPVALDHPDLAEATLRPLGPAPAGCPTGPHTADPAAGSAHAHDTPTGSSSPLAVGERSTTLTVPAAYTPQPPNGGTDEYRCFLVDPGLRAPAFLTGSQFRPGNLEIVHHAIVFRGRGRRGARRPAARRGRPR
jgi:hypothetical protein